VQESLIQELRTLLAQVEPSARSGKSGLLHFLTREAADEEQRGLEDDIKRLTDIAKVKDAIIAEKDKRIADLERIGLSNRLLISCSYSRNSARQNETFASTSMQKLSDPKLSRPKPLEISPRDLALVDVLAPVGCLVATNRNTQPS
jgi:hypothetical protein